MSLRKKIKTNLRNRRRSTKGKKSIFNFIEVCLDIASELEIVNQDLKGITDNISSGIIKIKNKDTDGEINNVTS